LRLGEEAPAFEHLADIPLSQIALNGTIDFRVTAPDDPRWKRVRRFWGDDGYIIAAISPKHRSMYCFESLGLRVRATTGTQQVGLERPTNVLYGYSPECENIGLRFRVPPGVTVQLHIESQQGKPMLTGELIVTSFWTGVMKDRIVGLTLAEDFRKIYRVFAICGVLILGFAGWLWLLQESKSQT